MSNRKDTQLCLICGDTADSLHFGAVSCRACAAFFRRTVAFKREFPRHCEQICRIDVDQRKLCASCRFRKCLKVGMNENSVVSRAMKTSGKKSNQYPILEKLQASYEKLNTKRKISFNITDDKTPQRCNYQTMNEITYTDTKLVVEFVVSTYEELMLHLCHEMLPKHEQKVLVAHFLCPFLFLECRFRSRKNENDLIVFLANGDYLDHSQLEEYYKNHDTDNDEKSEIAHAIYKPYWNLHDQVLKADMKEIDLDLSEFLYLAALMFWDFGTQDQSEQCVSLCRNLKNRILTELTEYEKNLDLNGDHSYRLARIMMLLQALQRNMMLMQQSLEISKIYDIYEHHCAFFEAMSVPTE